MRNMRLCQKVQSSGGRARWRRMRAWSTISKVSDSATLRITFARTLPVCLKRIFTKRDTLSCVSSQPAGLLQTAGEVHLAVQLGLVHVVTGGVGRAAGGLIQAHEAAAQLVVADGPAIARIGGLEGGPERGALAG